VKKGLQLGEFASPKETPHGWDGRRAAVRKKRKTNLPISQGEQKEGKGGEGREA